MWFSICNKITPRTTLSLHFTWAVALPCIRSPLFFCSPATMTISPISVIYCFLWFLSCGSASDCWQTPFANDAMRFLLNSSVVCLALWPLLPRSQCLQTRAHFPPHIITYCINVSSSPSLLLTCVSGRLLRCFLMSMTTVSNCSKVRGEVPRVL